LITFLRKVKYSISNAIVIVTYEIISVDFDVIGQLLIIYSYSAFVKYEYFRTKGNTMRQCISYL